MWKMPMDNPDSRVIEFKKINSTDPMFSKKPMGEESRCEHGPFVVSDRDRYVECKQCKQRIDPMHALILVANSEQRRRWMITAEQEHIQRENEKTLKAAVVYLAARGIDSSKFAELSGKYEQEIDSKKQHFKAKEELKNFSKAHGAKA